MTIVFKMSTSASMPNWRLKLKDFFEHPYTHVALGILILINIITLGFELSYFTAGVDCKRLMFFNHTVLWVFAVEIVGRMIAEGRVFFKDGWHIFDFVIVSLALLAYGGVIQAFRAFRLLWLLRMVSIFPQFKSLINSILRAIPGMIAIAFLLVLFIYLSSLIATIEFGGTHPEYSSILTSMGTLTRTMLMEHTWAERYEALEKIYPYAWLYIFPVMIILNYLLLHLILGIIITAVHKQYEEEEREHKMRFLEKLFQKTHHHEANPFSPETKAILQSLEEVKSYLRKGNGK